MSDTTLGVISLVIFGAGLAIFAFIIFSDVGPDKEDRRTPPPLSHNRNPGDGQKDP